MRSEAGLAGAGILDRPGERSVRDTFVALQQRDEEEALADRSRV